MTEQPGVPLIPNGPRHKHGERSHVFSIGGADAGSICPPILNRTLHMPSGSVHILKIVFLNDQVPNPKGVSAFEEEVCPTFLHSLAEGAKIIVWPSPLGQPINGPNSILKIQPSKELNF